MSSVPEFSILISGSKDLGSRGLSPLARQHYDYDESEPGFDIDGNDIAIAIRESVEGALQDIQGLPFKMASDRAEKYLSRMTFKTTMDIENDVHERDVPDHRGEHTTVPDRVYFIGHVEIVISASDDALFTALALDQDEWGSALREGLGDLDLKVESLKVSDRLSESLAQLSAQNQARFVAWRDATDEIKVMLAGTNNDLTQEQQVSEVDKRLKSAGFNVDKTELPVLVQTLKDGGDVYVDQYAPMPYNEAPKPKAVEVETPTEQTRRPALK